MRCLLLSNRETVLGCSASLKLYVVQPLGDHALLIGTLAITHFVDFSAVDPSNLEITNYLRT